MNVLSTPLSNRFISINGPEAIKFLQGQASCDLEALSDTNFTFGTLNTPKGRIYCLFKALKTKDGLLLSMNESLLESTLQRLNKYAVFSKCDLQEDTSYRAIGFTSIESNSYELLLDDKGIAKPALSAFSKSDEAFWLNISFQHRLGEVWLKNDASLPKPLDKDKAISLEHWQTLETITGIPELYASSQEEFILQYINLHHLNAVSFKKGCYAGQEIIARMKFLGKQKKQAYLLQCEQKVSAAPLSNLYTDDGKKCGTLIRAHYAQDTGTYALGILHIDSALAYKAVFLNEALTESFSVKEIDYSEFKI